LPTVQGRETAFKEPKVFQNIYLSRNNITGIGTVHDYYDYYHGKGFFNEKAGTIP
jgi:hypothetical protein